MAGGQCDGDRPLVHRDGAQRADLGQRQRVAGRGESVDQGEVDLAGGDLCGEHVLGEHPDHRFRPRVRPAHLAECAPQGRSDRQRGGAEHQPGTRGTGQARDVGARRLQPDQQRRGVLQQPLPGLGRADRAADQQGGAEVGFQRGDLLRDG